MSFLSLVRRILLILALVTIGFFAIRAGLGLPGMKARAIARWEDRLTADADLKKAGIETWVQERIADATVIAGYPGVVALASGEGEVDPRLPEILETSRTAYNYVAIRVFDADGEPIDGAGPDERLRPLVGLCVSKLRPHIEMEPGDDSVLAVAVPIISSGGEQAVGAVVIVTDPMDWLYPFLLNDAVPTQSKEALLAARDDNGVRFLSPLRFELESPGGSLNPGIAAAHALDDVTGVAEYVDYRGAPILAATRRIDLTDWALVVKVDLNEVLASYRTQLIDRGLGLATGLLAIITLLFVISALIRARTSLALARAETRLDALLDRANDAVFFVDRSSRRIIHANGTAENLYGYSLEELTGMTARDLRAPDERQALDRDARRIDSGSGMYETVHQHRDGTLIPVEVSARNLEVDGDSIILSIVRDIRERKASERKIDQFVRHLRTTSEIRQLIIREPDDRKLFEGVCRIAVQEGGFEACWIGVPEDDGSIEAVATAGVAESYLQDLPIRWDETSATAGPWVTAIREKRSVAIDDARETSHDRALDTQAIRLGLQSSTALPLMRNEHVAAVLNIYSTELSAFHGSILTLATEMALDVSLALETIERRRELEHARTQLLDAQAIAHLGSFELDLVRDRVELSPEAGAILGVSSSEPYHAGDLTRMIHPEDRERAKRTVREGQARGGATELRIVRPDSEERVVELRFIDVSDDGGSVVSRTGTILDITERVVAQSRLRAFFEAVPIGTIHGDIHGRVLDANDEFLRIVGRSREELEKGLVRWDDITPSEWADADAAGVAEAVELGSCTPYRKEYFRPDGSRVPVIVGYALLPPARQESVAFILDQTAQVEVEDSLRQLAEELEQRVKDRTRRLEVANEKLQEAMAEVEALYDHAPVAYHLINSEGRYVRINDTELGWLGYTRDEIIGRPIFELLASDVGQARTALADVKSEGIIRDVEVVFERKDGSHLPVVINSTAVYDEDGNFLMTRSSMTDDTRRRELMTELKNRNVELEEAVSQLEAFSYSVSHDLRAPLRAIDGFTRILSEEYAPRLDEEAKRLIGIVRSGAAEMSQLIDALLQFSRSSRHEIRRTHCDMTAMAEHAVSAHDLPETAVKIAKMPDIEGDPLLLAQVWSNLISNAVKFTSQEPRRLIEIDAVPENKRVIYRMRDNGVGFDMRYADKLFKVFHRLHSPSQFEGSGIGLALVKRIIDRHGGETGAEGEPGKGAMFWFSMPR